MSVRPIDTISMPTKSQEASQLQQQQHSRSENIQSNIVQAHEKAVMQDSRQTTETNKAQQHEYDYENGDGNGRSSGGSSGKKRQKKEEKKHEEKIKMSNFDITI